MNKEQGVILKMKVLLTGGLGFIGSHVAVELLNSEYDIIILDNLSNSYLETIDRITEITKKDFIFYNTDICDTIGISEIFLAHPDINYVLHFAGLKSVNESMSNPLDYYHNNVGGIISLTRVMKAFGCKNLIFSSSATVYGTQDFPVAETSETGKGITNPYGRSKYIIEEILKDLNINCISLRYFNPVGAHPSGLLNENPKGLPNNLMPYIVRSVLDDNITLTVFGSDYDTVDGTCIRDYIHVMDLAKGHLLALQRIGSLKGFNPFNLGTGKGTSVLQLIKIFEYVNNIKVKYVIGDRRPGDLPVVYASIDKATEILGFKPCYTIDDMCRDSLGKNLS
jgi:UDP-glucose 4-epimerase